MRYYFNADAKTTKLNIYITMEWTLNKIKKECFAINVHGKEGKETIVVTPSYSNTYGFDDYCRYGCEQHEHCNKPNWDSNCNLKSKIYTEHTHVTRHNKYSHETVRINGETADKSHPRKDYYAWEREDLQNLSDYELIDCFSISSVIVGRDIVPEYKKENKLELMLTAYEDMFYMVYVFVKPKKSDKLYDDLDKYSIDSYVAERENYDLVIAVQIVKDFDSNAICEYRGMYLSTHENNGIGDFKPLISN